MLAEMSLRIESLCALPAGQHGASLYASLTLCVDDSLR